MNIYIYLSLFFFVVFQHPVAALEDASERELRTYQYTNATTVPANSTAILR